MDINTAEFRLRRSVVVMKGAAGVAAVATLANISGRDVVFLSVPATRLVAG